MHYSDSVYGQVFIDEPIILDLISCHSVQRLKEIDQAGFLKPFRPDEDQITRFDHSVGVYLLLKLFGASLEEQVAGLIHDVSHTAFSHCADYLSSHKAQQSQSHQDDIFEDFVKKSEIPSILACYKIDLSFVLDDKHFPLKETSLPDLCADRIDYSLRTAIAAHVSSKEDILFFLKSLSTDGSKWIFQSVDAALKYANLFKHLNTHCYTGLTSATMLHSVGSVLRHALSKGYISYENLHTTDRTVLSLISTHASDDPELRILLDRMHNRVPYFDDTERFHARVFCKSRVVNPLCYNDGMLDRLSFFHKPWETVLSQEMTPKSYCIRFAE